MTNTYQLKVTLYETAPPIWRRLVVPGSLNLERLHRIIQAAMGWENSHLHSFEVQGAEFGEPDPVGWGAGPTVKSEKQFTLERLVGVEDRFSYTYDFGDSWVHEIVVEEVRPGEPHAPSCVAGAGACPPEDCGGAWGYGELLAALADPNHERHDELAEWVPPGWAADQFDLSRADRLVAKLGPQPGRARTSSTKRSSRARAGGR